MCLKRISLTVSAVQEVLPAHNVLFPVCITSFWYSSELHVGVQAQQGIYWVLNNDP